MKVYNVEITGEVEVTAETQEQAREMAEERIKNSEFNLNAGYVFEIEDLGDQE